MDFITENPSNIISIIIGCVLTVILMLIIARMRAWTSLQVPIWVVTLFVAIPIIYFVASLYKPPLPEGVVNQVFTQQRIVLDGNHFVRCNFDRCTLIFKGQSPFEFDQCTFISPIVIFESYAGTTVAQLQKMLRDSVFQPTIQNLIGGIQ
jgi:hypothetical protein